MTSAPWTNATAERVMARMERKNMVKEDLVVLMDLEYWRAKRRVADIPPFYTLTHIINNTPGDPKPDIRRRRLTVGVKDRMY